MNNGQKSETIQVRTDPQNAEEMRVMAKSYGLSVSAYLRMLVKRDYQAYRDVKLVPAVTAVVSTETVAE